MGITTSSDGNKDNTQVLVVNLIFFLIFVGFLISGCILTVSRRKIEMNQGTKLNKQKINAFPMANIKFKTSFIKKMQLKTLQDEIKLLRQDDIKLMIPYADFELCSFKQPQGQPTALVDHKPILSRISAIHFNGFQQFRDYKDLDKLFEGYENSVIDEYKKIYYKIIFGKITSEFDYACVDRFQTLQNEILSHVVQDNQISKNKDV